MTIHKGTELNNVNETWNENAKRREQGETLSNTGAAGNAGAIGGQLRETIKEEAAEYDNANKEERVLDGERASVNDDQHEGRSGE